jgi:RHS repeat-associated protein
MWVKTCLISFVLLTQSLIGTDFWISPAIARISGCPGGGPTPDPDELVWLPYRSFCQDVQTMASNPGKLIIDDYPEEDIPDCAEIKSERYMNSLRRRFPGCYVGAASDIETNIIQEHDLLCNGNVYQGYYVSDVIESYEQEFDVDCDPSDGNPPTRLLNTIGLKYYVREPIGPREIVEEKNRGLPQCGLSAGNPVNIATGNKYHRAQDTAFPDGLQIVRHYNSNDSALRSFGAGWRGSYSRKIDHVRSSAHGDVAIGVIRDDGAEKFWHVEGGILIAPPDAAGRLEITSDAGAITGYSYIPNDGSIETYDARGRLLSIADDRGQTLYLSYANGLLAEVASASGRALSYSYNPQGTVSGISSSDGSSWNYDYDVNGNLVQLTYPDGSLKTYHYENPDFPNVLTGETDELGKRIRSWVYDGNGRAILSTFGSPDSTVERNEIVYHADGSTTTLDSLQKTATHNFENALGIAKTGSVSEHCGDCSNTAKTTSYDSQGNRDIVTDFKGNAADYDYTANNFLQKVSYAAGTASKWVLTYQWDPAARKPVEIVRPGQSVTYSYNERGQLLNRTETDTASGASRSWDYRYFEAPSPAPLVGKVQTIDGPRGDVNDVTTFVYYTSDHPDGHHLQGDLEAIVNPLGHRIEYLKYDGNGRPLEIRDANGVLISMSYHARGWLNSRTVDGRMTSFSYDPAGNLMRVTQPDGAFTSYEYDDLHRLTAVADNFNNRVEYTLDAAGNRISEKTFDQGGVLRHQLSRVYDQLKRLQLMIDGNDDQTRYSYDGNGNLTGMEDALQNQTAYEFDALNRLVKSVDAMLGETYMAYDARGNLLSVTDPMGNISDFSYDGFNARTESNSPDSGVVSNEYDDAGNRTAMVDARGIRSEYDYDALNRITRIRYPDSSLDVSFTYDASANGIGRLSNMSDASGEVEYRYDKHGNLISETRTTEVSSFVTAYTYNDADRLTRITYPSGTSIDFTLDAAGRVIAIDKTGGSGTESLVSDIQYAPFGPVSAFSYGNGLNYAATFDLDYELDQLQSGSGIDWLLGYDPAGNLLSITDLDNGMNNQTFAYDDLYRLETALGIYGSEAFEYDGNGNRARYLNGGVDEGYAYEADSNRLKSRGQWNFERDAAGNRSAMLDGRVEIQQLSYAGHNRLAQASFRQDNGEIVSGDYAYDGRGQRVSKTVDGVTVHFIYGQSGELLGEYRAASSEIFTEYIYLNGQPIAVTSSKTEVFQPPGSELIVDNGDSGTSGSGSWQSKSNRKDYGPDYLFANKARGQNYRWTATPPGMMYDVYAWWVSGKSYSSQVNYTIGYGSGQTDSVSRSQRTGGGQWQFLGSYHRADGPDYVEASSADNKWVADAIRWVEVHDPIITITRATHFIHADHLGAPRRVTDQAQNIVWSWDSRPFGNTLPNEDPDGDFTNFTLNLRFPGQYHDSESGLHYNYFRMFDPSIGRYITADPIGLHGGLNPYSYVLNNPMLFNDPTGLYTSARWLSRPDLSGISSRKSGDIGFAEFWTVIPPAIGLGGAWWMLSAEISGVVECVDETKCGNEGRDVFDLSLHVDQRIGIGYGITTFPRLQILRKSVEAFSALSDAISFYRNQWTQLAMSLANNPMVWCMTLGAGDN